MGRVGKAAGSDDLRTYEFTSDHSKAPLAGVCSMRAVTVGGLRTRAGGILIWDAGIRSRAAAPDNAMFPWGDRMFAALLRYLMAHGRNEQGRGTSEAGRAKPVSRFPV